MAINRIRVMSIRAHVRPRLLCIVIICLVISRMSQICSIWIRLGSQRLGVVKMRQGKIIIIGKVEMPIIVGQMKGANKFSFIFSLREMGFLGV